LQLVFLDESHAKQLDFRRKYGYGIIGIPAFRYTYGSQHDQGTSNCGICAMTVEGMFISHVTEFNVDSAYFFSVLRDEVLPLMRPHTAFLLWIMHQLTITPKYLICAASMES
jgi:hypothetical protein